MLVSMHMRAYVGDSIDWIYKLKNGEYLKDIREWSRSCGHAGDGPWNVLYHVFDEWFPGSKYVLTVRNSTWEVVNSDIKMELRFRYDRKGVM